MELGEAMLLNLLKYLRFLSPGRCDIQRESNTMYYQFLQEQAYGVRTCNWNTLEIPRHADIVTVAFRANVMPTYSQS